MHGSFTRIDYLLVDYRLISKVINTTYHSILISDHAPLSMAIDFNLCAPQYNWKLNPSLYSEVPYSSYISAKIVDFLHINDNRAVSDSTLWETFKVVIRGHIISYPSFRKRARLKRLIDIEARLLELEDSYHTTGSDDTLSSILKVKYEYNHILGEQVGNNNSKLKQKHFELGVEAVEGCPS